MEQPSKWGVLPVAVRAVVRRTAALRSGGKFWRHIRDENGEPNGGKEGHVLLKNRPIQQGYIPFLLVRYRSDKLRRGCSFFWRR